MINRVAAAFLTLACAVIGLGAFPLGTWIWIVMLSSAVGTALVGGAIWWGAVRGARLGDDPGSDRRWARSVFAAAIVMRLLLIPAGHYLSDDAFRYHWDGKVLASGMNPYLYAPSDEAVAHLRGDTADTLINHPDVVTVYPPFPELVFAASHLISPGRLWGFQVLSLVAEIFAWIVLFREASRRRLPRTHLLVAAWLPLALVESYLPGHTEALAFPFVALFLVAAARGAPYRAGVMLALATLVKPVALLFAPAAIRELGPRRSLRLVPGFVVTVAAFYLPFLHAGENLWSSMLLMAREWSFNGSLAPLLGTFLPEPVLRPVLAVLLAAGVAAATLAGRDLISRALYAFIVLVLVTPTLYPWYLLWAVPLLTLRPRPALLALCALVPFAHVAVIALYGSGTWDPPLWPSLLAYVPFVVLLVLERRISGWRGLGTTRASA